MHARRVVRTAAALAAFGLVGAACGGDDDDTGSGPSSSAAPSTSTSAGAPTSGSATTVATEQDVCTDERKGGEVTFGTLIPSQGLDPTVAQGSGSAGGIELTAVYDTLLRFDPETGEYTPHVATSVEANDDLTEWTVTLRDGIEFGNGDPLTADAVKFSLDRMKTARVSSAGLAAEIAEVEVVDDLTVVLHLVAPSAQIPYLLAEDTGNITNPAVVTALGNDAFNLNPVGAGVGPYEVTRFAPNEEIVLTAKDDYWGGPVCIETLRFVWVQGAQGTLDAFSKDELQMAFLREPKVVAAARDDGVEGHSNVAGAGTILLMNIAAGGATTPMSDVRVRQAVQHALDLDLLNDRVHGGAGLPTSALFDEDSPIYAGPGLPYDLDAAKALVAEAKAAGWDGAVTLSCGNTPVANEQSLAIQAMLRAADIDLTVENLPNNELTARYTASPFNYEMACGGSSIFEESPLARLNSYEGGSPRNRTGLADPDMDAALAVLRVAETREEKKEALEAVQELWNELLPSAVLESAEEFIAIDPAVHGLVWSRDTIPMFHLAYLES